MRDRGNCSPGAQTGILIRFVHCPPSFLIRRLGGFFGLPSNFMKVLGSHRIPLLRFLIPP
jgi:hypothetical protein